MKHSNYSLLKLSFSALIILGCVVSCKQSIDTNENSTNDKMPLGINSGFYSPSSGEQPFKEGFKTSNWQTAEDPWNPAFREDYSIFTAIRFHQWHRVSFSNDCNWEDRASVDVDYPVSSGGGIAMPYEWEIRMCNDFNADYWINCPALATEEYMMQYAQLIKDQLNPNLKVYVEWSNEVWNPDYAEGGRWDHDSLYNGQYSVAVDRGKELGFAEDNWNAGGLYSVHIHVKLWHAFEKVFGEEAEKRIVKVMPGMLDGSGFWLGNVHMRGLKDSSVNVYNLQPDVYAVNCYFGGRVDGNVEDAFDKLSEEVNRIDKSLQVVRDSLDKSGLENVEIMVYEGGQHLLQNADIASRNPKMYDLYIQMLNKASQEVELFMYYSGARKYSSNNAFGMKEYTGQSMDESHKYRALFDWVNSVDRK